jgi:sarcosine oxidase, subunit gamma
VHDLRAITPLGRSEPVVEVHGTVTMTEVTDVALASVAARRGREPETLAALERVLGDAPPAPGCLGGKTLTAFWMGPDLWMIEAPNDTHEDLAAQLAALSSGAMSVTEQTDAWCRFDLTGERLADVFERLCAANIRAFQGGEAVRTTIHHLGCYILCRTPAHMSVIGARSSAGSLHHALRTALVSAL